MMNRAIRLVAAQHLICEACAITEIKPGDVYYRTRTEIVVCTICAGEMPEPAEAERYQYVFIHDNPNELANYANAGYKVCAVIQSWVGPVQGAHPPRIILERKVKRDDDKTD